MIRLLSRQMHGILTDYPYVLIVGASPYLFGFADVPSAVLATRLLAGTILLSSLLTRAEWGLFRVMPYKFHLVLDVLGGVTALASPWLFGFSGNRNATVFAIGAGIFGLFAGLCSKTEDMGQEGRLVAGR